MQEQEFQEWTGAVLEEVFELGGRVLLVLSACLLAVLSMLEDLLDEIV